MIREASIHRVADRYLSASDPDPGNDVQDIQYQLHLMRRLIAKGESRRIGRVTDVRVRSLKYDGDRVWAQVQGKTDVYHPWITIRPQPGHHCNCPDWQQNGKRVGPCKHVLRVAEDWEDLLIGKLERI